MINAITSSSPASIPYSASSSAVLATLQKELVAYEKQLAEAQNGTVGAGAVQTQLLAAQVSLLTAQIVGLSGVTPVSFAQPLQNPVALATIGQPVAVSTSASTGAANTAAVAVPTPPPTPVPSTAAATSVLPDQAAVGQAQATLSAIFEKASVQGTVGNSTVSTSSSTSASSSASVGSALATSAAPVGSTINVLV